MKLFQKGELKLLWPFYLDSIVSPMLYFIYAFYILYFLSLDFSMFQIGILTATIPLFSLLFEIPTGAIADIYGRKFSVLLGTIIEGIAFFLVFFTNNFYEILPLMALAGFGSTFNSGAHEAWVTDLIKTKNKNFIHSFFAKTTSFDNFGLVISGLIGAFFVKQYGLSIIWLATGFSYLVSFIILVFGEEHFTRKKVKIKSSFKKINKQTVDSIRYTKKHHVLFYFLIASIILVIAGGFSSEVSWTPFLKSLGLAEHAFGYLWSALALIGIIAPIASSKLSKNKEKKFLLQILILIIITTLSVIFITNYIIAFSIMVILTFFTFVSQPVERVFFHKYIPSKLRATIGSVESMALSIAAIIAMPLAGLTIDSIGAQYTIFISGILMIPAAIILSKITEK